MGCGVILQGKKMVIRNGEISAEYIFCRYISFIFLL
jgi:hypothetical protein